MQAVKSKGLRAAVGARAFAWATGALAVTAVFLLVFVLVFLVPATARAGDTTILAGRELTLADDIVLMDGDSLIAGAASGGRCTIHGAGHLISAGTGNTPWTGNLTIVNCDIDGLGIAGGKAIDATGAETITIQGSTFSASGQISLIMGPDTSVTFQGNTIQADSVVNVVQESLDQSQPSFYSKGSSTGLKRFQGNRILKSTIYFEGTGDWLIGGDTPAEGNVLVGFRTGIFIGRSGPMTIRGNYSHTLGAGWNQVKNLSVFSPSGGALTVEHNVFIGCGWNTEVHGPGELRYNLFMNPQDRAWVQLWESEHIKVHHNVMVQTSDNQHPTIQGGFVAFGDFDTGLSDGSPHAEIYNNTLDAGGTCNPGVAGAVTIDTTGVGSLASLRSNVFANIRLPSWTGISLVGQRPKTMPNPLPIGLGYTDYNLFFNGDASVKANYDVGVAGKTARSDPGFGYNDVPAGGMINAQVDPRFAGFGGKIPRIFPFADGKLSEAAPSMIDSLMMNGSVSVCQILAYYRQAYTPAPGSPLIDAGDPQEGPGNDIGAIGAGTPNDLDLFGRLCDPADIGSPLTTADVYKCKDVTLQGGGGGVDPVPVGPHGFACVCQVDASASPAQGLIVMTVLAALPLVRRRRSKHRRKQTSK
jgi:MYXO-CTERM domain-containing protein